MSSGSGIGNVATSLEALFKESRKHGGCNNAQEYASNLTTAGGGAGDSMILDEVGAGKTLLINTLSGNGMEVDNELGRGCAGHSVDMEAAGNDSNGSDMLKNKECTQGGCGNVSMHLNSARGTTNAAGRGVNVNAWNRQKIIAFANSEEAVRAAKMEGPVILNENAMNANLEKLDKALVGRTLGRRVPFSFLRTELNRLWSQFGDFKLIKVSPECFICIFESHDSRDVVLLGGPWTVAGHIIGIDIWKQSFSPTSLEGFMSPIWIRLPHLPLQVWDDWNISRIVAKLGQPLGMDAQTSEWGRCTYARACVRLDLSKKLPTGVWIKGRDKDFFQPVEYEGISLLCFNCGVVGHKVENCPLLLQKQRKLDSTPDSQLSEPRSQALANPTAVADPITAGEHADAQPSGVHVRGDSLGSYGKDPRSIDGQEYGSWVLVSRKKNRPKSDQAKEVVKAPRITSRRGSEIAKEFEQPAAAPNKLTSSPLIQNDGGENSNSSGQHKPVKLEHQIPTPDSMVNNLRPSGASKPADTMDGDLLASPLDAEIVNSPHSTGKGYGGRTRISKSHFEKELRRLGPIEFKKRRKNKIIFTDGGAASPMGT